MRSAAISPGVPGMSVFSHALSPFRSKCCSGFWILSSFRHLEFFESWGFDTEILVLFWFGLALFFARWLKALHINYITIHSKPECIKMSSQIEGVFQIIWISQIKISNLAYRYKSISGSLVFFSAKIWQAIFLTICWVRVLYVNFFSYLNSDMYLHWSPQLYMWVSL